MSARSLRLVVSCGLIVVGLASSSKAQAPYPNCCEMHARQAAMANVQGRAPISSRSMFGTFGNGRAGAARPGGDPYGRPSLPRGQVYYGGRFFGSFNNRFYGPQYGNF